MTCWLRLLSCLCLCLGGVSAAGAQSPAAPGAASGVLGPVLASPPALAAPSAPAQETFRGYGVLRSDRRACDGCPRRSVGKAFLHELYVNTFYGLANLARGQVTARITPASWWENMQRGWEWDLDDFTVNQFGHPYQGSNYFNAGRSNGLSFWESAALTAFGSGTWEYFGETNRASLNDFINTTMGGIALGEMFHRAAWLVRDPRATGKARQQRELIALAIDPVTGLNRLLSDEWSRVSDVPEDVVPSQLGLDGAAGALWRGSSAREIESTVSPFLEVDLYYGDPAVPVERPYDRFVVRFDFGGGAGLSEVRVRGELMGREMRELMGGRLRGSVVQGYQYNANPAYRFGAQSFMGQAEFDRPIGRRYALWVGGTGGMTLLGAVDSLPPGEVVAPEEPDDPDAGQGVSTGPRNYDYGPGGNFGAAAILRRNGRDFLTFSYEGYHVFALDGIRANHLLQRGRAAIRVPIRGRFGVGFTAEYFRRHTYYRDETSPDAEFNFPQFRGALTWDLH